MKRTFLQTKASGLTAFSDSQRYEVLFFSTAHFLFFYSPAHIAHNCKPHKPTHKPKLAIECNLPTLLFFVASLLLTSNLSGQIQTPQPPQPFQFQQVNPGHSYPKQNPTQQNNQQDIINKRNEEIIRQTQQQQNQKRQPLDEIYREIEEDEKRNTVLYSFPSFSAMQGTNIFRKAFASIDSMLNGLTPLDIKKAVFIFENAYHGNTLSYDKFNKEIKYIADVCKQKLVKDGYGLGNNAAKNLIIYQVMCDTVDVQNPKTKVFYKHYPYLYDFNDYRGDKEFANIFVTKVLRTHKGQCRSLPLLYLILAQELETDAFLTFAPEHSFIRFQDNKQQWHNIELTNRKLSSDAWILGSGYIKAEALANSIYLDTLSKKQTIANLLLDLREAYTLKFGYDEFSLKCINRVLETSPNNIFAWMEYSDYYTLHFHYVAKQKGKPDLSTIMKDPKAKAVYEKRNQIYDTLDNISFEQMPKEAYEEWLKSIDQEMAKQGLKTVSTK